MRTILSILCQLLAWVYAAQANDVAGCGGFVVSSVSINYSPIKIKLYTSQGVVKFQTDCAPNNGYYFTPLYDHGDYVLRIEPPKGWSFDPMQVPFTFDGKTDICSKQMDINFVFKGFSVFGKVFSPDSSDGPSGVKVTLLAANSNNVIKHNTTQPAGLFSFHDILPGQYIVEASHEKWKFEQNRLVLNIAGDNVNLQNIEDPVASDQIRVLGYSTAGKVVSDGQPIRGVQFALFSKDAPSSRKIACGDASKSLFLSNLNLSSQLKYLCHVSSDAEGVFQLKFLPVGKYVLYSWYEAQNIRFEVSPNTLEFDVKHDDVAIEMPFQIGGFTIFGSVTNTLSPKEPIRGTGLTLIDKNGKAQPIRVNVNTDDGSFSVDNIKTSNYIIKTTAPHYQFEDITFAISPNSPNLPVISPVKFEVCSRVTFLKYAPKYGEVKLVVHQKDADNTVVESMAFEKGKACLYLPGGHYRFKIANKYAELRFTPEFVDLKVNKPELNLAFEQFTASISGKVELSSPVQQVNADQLLITLSRGPELLESAQLEVISSTRYQFKFTHVLPGEYTISLTGKMAALFCWDKESISAKIIDSNISDALFVQKGVYMEISLSHSTDLTIQSPSGKKVKIAKSSIGPERIVRQCVAEQGKYQISSHGCHKFSEGEQDTFSFDTASMAKGQILTLTAVQHLVTAKIKSVSNLSDLNVKISVRSLTEQYEKDVALSEIQTDGQYWYSLSFYERPMVDIRIEPISSLLLFRPAVYEFKLKDDCYEDAVLFTGRFGLFINGQVTPPIEDVAIQVLDTETNEVIFTATTDSKGKYSGGPFDDELKLQIEAAKDGYVMKPVAGKLGHFEAHQLCSISTTIVDQNGEPLSDVLVSLSGGENNFRKNSVANSDGQLRLENLQPGQYFIRFMRKEYEFEPASKMITVTSGEDHLEHVVGTKVAFSCFGVVDSLNREPEAGVVVEAIGLRNLVANSTVQCSTIQEQAISEADGSYKILGLLPECFFAIRLKIDNHENIRESIPRLHSVRVHDRDIADLRFVVLFKEFQMDVSINIKTAPEFVSSLTVQLFGPDESQGAIFKQSLSTSPFVFFPTLPLDQKQYTIRIDSDLSSVLYQYSPIIYTFTANQSYAHYSFDFTPKMRQTYSTMSSSEHEAASNPLYSVPLFILGFIFYYNKRALDFLRNLSQYGDRLTSVVFGKRNLSSSTESAAAKKKLKKKAN